MPGGFWHYAQQDPAWLAVVDPDGTEYRAGDVLARCNQMVHGLRELGLGVGDTVAAILPNGIDPTIVYLAALQAGFFYVPINYRLSPPEIAYILGDSRREGVRDPRALRGDGNRRGRRRRHPGRGPPRARQRAGLSRHRRVPRRSPDRAAR